MLNFPCFEVQNVFRSLSTTTYRDPNLKWKNRKTTRVRSWYLRHMTKLEKILSKPYSHLARTFFCYLRHFYGKSRPTNFITKSTSEQQPLVNYEQRPHDSGQKKPVYNNHFNDVLVKLTLKARSQKTTLECCNHFFLSMIFYPANILLSRKSDARSNVINHLSSPKIGKQLELGSRSK